MKGLYKKYIVFKTSGKSVGPNFRSLVLRIDGGIYLNACRAGAAAFAEAVREHNPKLADDVQQLLTDLKEKP